MLWAALLLSQSNDHALRGLATWALQVTPRGAVAADAVTMEVEASLRLFGGERALRDRVVNKSRELGVRAVACAQTWLPSPSRTGREKLPMKTVICVPRRQRELRPPTMLMRYIYTDLTWASKKWTKNICGRLLASRLGLY